MSAVRRTAALLAVLLALAMVAVATSELAALRAAGLNGTAPPGADAFKGIISTLASNWEWLIGTGIGLAFTLVAGLMIFGSQRAPDHLFRIIGGVLLILVVIPAVLA
jgi:hypothetical protein